MKTQIALCAAAIALLSTSVSARAAIFLPFPDTIATFPVSGTAVADTPAQGCGSRCPFFGTLMINVTTGAVTAPQTSPSRACPRSKRCTVLLNMGHRIGLLTQTTGRPAGIWPLLFSPRHRRRARWWASPEAALLVAASTNLTPAQPVASGASPSRASPNPRRGR